MYLQLKKNGLCPKCAALGGTIASRCSSLSRCFQRSNPARNGRANRPPNPAQNPLLIPAPKSYNRSDMQLASSRALREPPPAAMRLGGEKPHQGLSSKKPASHRGLNRCKSMTALWASQSWRPESVPGATVFRKYDPSAGRWLSPDPLGWGAVSPADPQSLNRYSYVENQPLEAVDPDGYSCITAQFNNNGTLVSVTLDDGDGKGCAAAGVLPNGTITNPWTATVNGNDADGLDPEGCDPNSNAACMPTLGGVPTYGFSGPARNGPTYSQSQVCGASAMLHGGVSFFLDAIGVIPGEGNLLSGVQLGAGILSGSITAADPESKLPDGILAGGGIALSLADMTKTASFGEVPEVLTNIVSRASFGLIPKELSVIPVIGNFASAYSAVKDWNSMWKAYHDCMGGS